ncbi:MAG TPA: hypothetical protein VFN09_09570 [Rhodanobacteraceae bacterium]|nr:hypothetical protein [Rhodanobacteraceae bacterium]
MHTWLTRWACLLAVWSGGVMAGSALRVDRVTATGFHVSVTGVWPDACTPRLLSWAPWAQGFDVLIGSPQAECAAGAHAFRLELSLDDAFSPALPGEAVRPLRIFAARGNETPRLVGFRLLGGSGSMAPETGFWWPLDGTASGNAISLERQGDHLGIALLSHDARGEPEWFFGTTTLEGRLAHAELSRLTGSSLFAGGSASTQAQPALRVELAFASSTRLRMWLSRQADSRGELDLVASDLERRSFSPLPAQQAWLGEWLLAGGAGLPSQLRWVGSRYDRRGGLSYHSAEGGYTLECRSTASDGAVEQCRLRDAQGIIRARFDQVGLDRLDGEDEQGRPVVMLRPR